MSQVQPISDIYASKTVDSINKAIDEQNVQAVESILESNNHHRSDGTLDVDLIAKCPLCKQWQSFCLSEPKSEEADVIRKWSTEKQEYWDKHKEHLENNGQSFAGTMAKALDNLETMIVANSSKNLDGCLLIARVGSKEHPPAQIDLQKTYNLMNELLKDVKGVRVLVTTPDFAIEKISLPQLRNLQLSLIHI